MFEERKKIHEAKMKNLEIGKTNEECEKKKVYRELSEIEFTREERYPKTFAKHTATRN